MKDLANRTSTVKPKSLTQRTKPVQSSSSVPVVDTLEEIFASAAYRVAEAEAKSFFAAEATKEFERVAKMAEETEVMLQLAEEIHQKCNYRMKTTLVCFHDCSAAMF